MRDEACRRIFTHVVLLDLTDGRNMVKLCLVVLPSVVNEKGKKVRRLCQTSET